MRKGYSLWLEYLGCVAARSGIATRATQEEVRKRATGARPAPGPKGGSGCWLSRTDETYSFTALFIILFENAEARFLFRRLKIKVLAVVSGMILHSLSLGV